jgi:hypothetical protein
MQNTPVLFDLGKRYDLIVNIERANISEAAGWAQVTLKGEQDEIQRAVAYLNTLGVFVSPVELAVIA